MSTLKSHQQPGSSNMSSSLFEDYLKASADATSRTRSALIILIIASVLSLTGLFNSLDTSWMHERLKTLRDPYGSYMAKKIGAPPSLVDYKGDATKMQIATDLYKKRQEALCVAVANAYVEGSFIVHVPFFGFTFDVNDLGLLSGVGFLIILSCFRFFLARELDNLRISFAEARDQSDEELKRFYRLLAMRQVFTIPQGQYLTRSKFLLYVPKMIPWLPCALLISIVIHDFVTIKIGMSLESARFFLEQSLSIIAFGAIFRISFVIVKRMLWMDDIWDAAYDFWRANPQDRIREERRWDEVFNRNHKNFEVPRLRLSGSRYPVQTP